MLEENREEKWPEKITNEQVIERIGGRGHF